MSLPALARQKKQQNRTYVHPNTGQEYPSVTTITRVKDKSDALVGWAVRETVDFAVKNWEELTKATAKVKRFLLKGSRFEVKVPGTSLSPSKAGDLVHDIIEGYINTGVPVFSDHALQLCAKLEIEPTQAMIEIMPWFEQFLHWEKKWNPTWLLAEATVFNHTVGYAGTLDCLFEINGRTYLGDFKSGKATYPEYSFQLHALANGEEVVKLDGTVTPLPHIDAMCIIHITPKFLDWTEVREDTETWRAFRALSVVQQWDVNRAHLQFGTTVRSVYEAPEAVGEVGP